MTSQVSDKDFRRNIGIRLTVVARLLRSDFDKFVSGINITRSQWSLIVMVARRPGATQRVIAEALEMSEASAGRLIDKLCSEGLLRREARDDDRRARSVYLTEAAEPLLAQVADIARKAEARVFRGFSDAELQALDGALEKLYTNLTTD